MRFIHSPSEIDYLRLAEMTSGHHNSQSQLNKTFPSSKLCVHKQCPQCSRSRAETQVTPRAKSHAVSRLLMLQNSDSSVTADSGWKNASGIE